LTDHDGYDDGRYGLYILADKPVFTFNGTIKKVTFNVGPLQFAENDSADQKYAGVIAYD
jgi:hypothetical protein